jgi:hypothetical protein
MPKRGRAALGFAVHTGWAAMVAVGWGTAKSAAILDRRRVIMIARGDPQRPAFIYHAASKLPPDAAERLIRESAELSFANAKTALRAVLEALRAKEYEVVASGIVVGGRPLAAPLEKVLHSHPLIHTAEGELFRGALRRATEALDMPATEVRARDLHSRAAVALAIPVGSVIEHLAEMGGAAGSPWAKDQKDGYLAGVIALSTRFRASDA